MEFVIDNTNRVNRCCQYYAFCIFLSGICLSSNPFDLECVVVLLKKVLTFGFRYLDPCRNQEKSSLSIDGQLLTKRQKLEAGFLRKVAHLKHQTLLTHKTKEVINFKRSLIHYSVVNSRSHKLRFV